MWLVANVIAELQAVAFKGFKLLLHDAALSMRMRGRLNCLAMGLVAPTHIAHTAMARKPLVLVDTMYTARTIALSPR